MHSNSTPVTLPEEWRPVVGYEGVYSVSNPGRVRRDVRRRNFFAGTLLRPSKTPTGYWEVRLGLRGQARNHMVHALVAAAFIGPRPPEKQVNHKDGDKLNATLSNLEYVTDAENKAHAAMLGLLPFGERHWHARLTEDAVRRIWEVSKRPFYGWRTAVAKELGVSDTAVRHVLYGNSWRRVSKELGCDLR